MDQQEILREVLAWARADDNTRVLVLTGSLARGDEGDELSDLDLELYVTDPAALLNDDVWYRQFGEVLVVEALENPGWHPTRLVYYAGGKIDFMIAPVLSLKDGVEYDRPFDVLLDKDGATGAFRLVEPDQQRPPTEEEFLRSFNWFYAAALMWAKCLSRGEPWQAKIRDWDSKCELLTMLEWDHKARHGWEYDTWFNGKKLCLWVDPELLPRIEACWAGFSAEDSTRALQASTDLFDELCGRTASALGFEPFESQGVHREVQALLQRE